MKILWTSDWQADVDNLDRCEKVVEEILRIRKQYGVEWLVHCGDWKRAYNPIQVQLVNWTIATITRLEQAGLRVVVLLGNHDRVGLHVDTQSWLPVLKKAGAVVADEPTITGIGEGWELRLLPYRKSDVVARREAADLAASATKKSILVFHADLKTARYNMLTRSEAPLKLEDLKTEKYLVAVGGHLHLQQQLSRNAYYVGSPFATDWGEANQKKGYLLLDTTVRGTLKIQSKIPGWYDEQWPGFEKARPKSWTGARVRIHVSCKGVADVAERLEIVRAQKSEEYAGAEIVLVPEVEIEEQTGVKIRATDSDETKVAEYVRQTCPDELKVRQQQVVQYVLEQVKQVGGLQRSQGQLEFKAIQAENFLSFRNLNMMFKKGLTVVVGENRDRKGKSNGAGKTGLLSPVAVALCGQTFKGQKHDRWMNRRVAEKEPSYVALRFEDGEGRRVVVKRSRRPKELRVWVQGKELSSGNRPEQAQELIERLSGYTWETLSNSVYVDQARANLMLTGTEAERKKFLSRLQNLERFELALARVRNERKETEWEQAAQETAEADAKATYHSFAELLKETTKSGRNLEVAVVNLEKYKKAVTQVRDRLKREVDEEMAAQKEADERDEVIEKQLREWMTERGVAGSEREHRREDKESLAEFKGTCPRCKQPVTAQWTRTRSNELVREINTLSTRIRGLDGDITRLQNGLRGLQTAPNRDRSPHTRERLEELQEGLRRWKTEVELATAQERQAKGLKEKMAEQRLKIVRAQQKRKQAVEQVQLLGYAERILMRNGLPAFLNVHLMPELNRAAAYYAEEFTGKEIQVGFKIDAEGEMDVTVINPNGGTLVEDQSQGEMRVASLVTSFAIREVAPRTNLLILDEPAEGLDTASVRQFARGLKRVAKRFGTILVTTHNPTLLAELGEERVIRVVKEQGQSRVEGSRRWCT